MFSREKPQCPPELQPTHYVPAVESTINGAYDGYVSFGGNVPKPDEHAHIVIRTSKYKIPSGDCRCYISIFNGGISNIEASCKKSKDGKRRCEVFNDGCKILTDGFEQKINSFYTDVINTGFQEKNKQLAILNSKST